MPAGPGTVGFLMIRQIIQSLFQGLIHFSRRDRLSGRRADTKTVFRLVIRAVPADG